MPTFLSRCVRECVCVDGVIVLFESLILAGNSRQRNEELEQLQRLLQETMQERSKLQREVASLQAQCNQYGLA